MKTIVENALSKLTKKSSLDEIKTVLKIECEKAPFEITKDDWQEMINNILCELA